MALIRKTQLINGRSVTMDTTKTTDKDGNVIFEVTAACGKSVVVCRHTLQPGSGKTVQQLQSDLDDFRARCAEEAAGRENIAEVSGLVS